jgi:hypothetical protein
MGANDWLLKYDHVPKWMPTADTAEDAHDSPYVYMRKDFIEKYCKEWV